MEHTLWNTLTKTISQFTSLKTQTHKKTKILLHTSIVSYGDAKIGDF